MLKVRDLHRKSEAGVSDERTREDRIAGLIEQIRRDKSVLAGPEKYIVDRAFYEERIAGCQETARALSAAR